MTNLEEYSSIKEEFGGDIDQAKDAFRARHGYDVIKANLNEELQSGQRRDAGPPPLEAGPEPIEDEPAPEAGPTPDAGPPLAERPSAGPESILTEEDKAKLPKPTIFKQGAPFSLVEDVIEPSAEVVSKLAGIAVGATGLPTAYRTAKTAATGIQLTPLVSELKQINKKLESEVYGKDEYYNMMARGKELSAQIKKLEKEVKPDPILQTYKHMAETAKKRLGKDFYENWTASTGQVKESTIALLAQLADVEAKDETIVEGMQRAFMEGMGMPEQLVGGAVGMLSHTVRHPVDTWRTQPAEVLLILAPFIPKLVGLARAGNVAAAGALADLAGKPGIYAGLKRMGIKGLNKGFEFADKPLPEVAGMRPVKKIPVEEITPGVFSSGTRPMTVGDVAVAAGKGAIIGLLVDEATAGAVLVPLVSILRGYKPGLGTETLRKWLVDNAANSNAKLEALTRRIQFEPEIVADEIMVAGERIAKEQARFEKSPLRDVVSEIIETGTTASNLSDVWQGIPQLVKMMDDLWINMTREEYLAFLEASLKDSRALLESIRRDPDGAVASIGGKVSAKATDILLPELEAKFDLIRRRIEKSDVEGAEAIFKEIVDDLKVADEKLQIALKPPAVIVGPEQPVNIEKYDSEGRYLGKSSKTKASLEARETSPVVKELVTQIEKFLPEDSNVAIRIAESLSEHTVNNLADGRVMKLVVKELVNRGVPKATAEQALKSLLEQHRKGESIDAFMFGDIVSIDLISDAVAKVPEIREAILMETVGRIAQEGAKENRRAFIEEKTGPYQDFTGDVVPNTSMATNLLNALVTNDILGSNPLFSLPKGLDPISIVRIMDDGYIARKAREISGPELSAAEATRQLKGLRRRLGKMKEHESGWLDSNVFDAMDWFDKAQASLVGRESWARNASQWVKRHVTVGNATSAANNSIANVILQSIRRGIPIPVYVARNIKIGREWLKFIDDPASIPPELSAKLRALQKTGEIGTDAVAIELSMTEGSSIASISKYIPARLSALMAEGTWNGKLAQAAYRYGDVLPKLEEGMFQLNRTIKDLNETLKPGESAKILTKQGEVTIVTRTESGWRIQGKDYSSLLDEGALDALAKAAMQPGRRLFFNYSDTGRLGKVLRSAPIIGIASPFYTWFSKAFFGPGGGLMGNVIRGTSEVIQSTDSATLTGRLVKQGAADSLARATLAQAQDIETRRTKDKLRKILSWDPQLADSIILGQVSDPKFLDTKTIGSWSFDGPFNMGLRNVMGAWAWAAPGAQTTAKEMLAGAATPEDKRRMSLWMKQKAGERLNVSDMLDIVGLGGGPIVDAWETIKQDGENKWGKVLTADRILQTFGAGLIGGTAVKQIQVARAGLQEAGVVKGLPKDVAVDIEQLKETFPKYAIRKLIGLGLRPTLMVKAGKRRGAIKNYLTRFEKKLKASLLGSYKKEIKRLAMVGKKEEAKALAQDAGMWKMAIKKEVLEVKKELYEVLDLLKVLEKR